MPNKKNPRIRNRPRNKANRLKLLKNQEDEKEHQVQLEAEFNDHNCSDVDDIDLPDLMDEQSEINVKLEQDPTKALQNLLESKFLQKDFTNDETCGTGLKLDNKTVKSANSVNCKAVTPKESENALIASEKNAFIQNLQKKMETMMANGDESVPNTVMENLKKMFDHGPVTGIETSDDEDEYIEYIYRPRKYFLVSLCNLCKTDLCQISQQIECSKCHMTYYCRLEHMQNDAEHQKLCRALQQVAKESCDLPENSDYASLTQISTGPLTAWYALNLADRLENRESLTIHLIGAEIEFEVDVLQKWELFFLHITPGVKMLKIVFVGPELNPNNISFEQLEKTKCCSVCRKSGRNVQYFFKSYIYHDYCRSDKFLVPNLICFFNAGLYRSTGYKMEDTWPETIFAASKLSAPIVVTAYTEYESPLDLDRFTEESQRRMRLVQPPSQNPFASVKPERNFISDDEAPLMFKNYYCFVVE